jgi:hypothetical protein
MDYIRKGSVEKKNMWSWASRGWRQYELIGGKPPVVMYGYSDFDFEIQSVCEEKTRRSVWDGRQPGS